MAQSGDYLAASLPHRERGKQVRSLIKQVLSDAKVTVHSVTHRVKTEQSATAKIDASPNKYGSFRDLHDLLGVRVITYLATEVEVVVKVLRGEFEVDEVRTFDKLKDLNADEFGYRSYHLVVKLREERAALAEWRIFAGIFFEIQVRSILQHAWAEIEHDLGYKSSVDVPPEIRRRFARLSGLLELADDEFVGLTKDANSQAKKTDAAVKRGANVAVDRDSIMSLSTLSGPVNRADAEIARVLGWRLLSEPTTEYATLRAKELREVGLETVAEVRRAMESAEEDVVRFATLWLDFKMPSSRDVDDEFMFMGENEQYFDDEDERVVTPGLSLFYLYLHLQLERQGEDFDSVPTDPHEFDDDGYGPEEYAARDFRRTAFRRLHDEIFRAEDR